MLALIMGLLVFIGIHLVPALAPGFRGRISVRISLIGWRIAHSLLALIGLYLIVIGYASARLEPVWLWFSPAWFNHITAVLMLIAFILVGSAWAPSNPIKYKLGYPGLLAVKTWAVSHLLVNGTLADLLLFGTFLTWASISFATHRRRDRISVKPVSQRISQSKHRFRNLAVALVIGVSLTFVVALWLHPVLIGVSVISHS